MPDSHSLVLRGLAGLLALCLSPMLAASDYDDVDALLSGFHAAAARADFDDYFSRFAGDGVFLGTDASERWTVEEFKVYAKAPFDEGRGWTYTKTDRHIMFSPGGDVAWFDEILDNERLGRCRGTGVVRRVGNTWKVSHYSLTLLVPNEIALEVGTMTRRVDAGVGQDAP